MPRKNNLLLETQEARRDKEGFFPRFFEEEHYPAYTLISDIYPGELGDSFCFKPPVSGTRKLNTVVMNSY